MSPLPQEIERVFRAQRFMRRGRVLVVAVSGGLDSMVLLDAMDRLRRQQGGRLAVAHFNHQLRGRASDADERLVRREAERRGLPFVSEQAKVAAHARRTGQSVEMAARELRHAFLGRVARQFKAGAVALAHHADDQVELFLLRLLRGAGGEGLAGMRFRGPSPADRRVTLVRPLLAMSRADLAAYAKGQGIRFREDASNTALDLKRNRVRHELLPLLARHYQSAVRVVIQRTMEVLGDEAEFVRETAARWLKARKRDVFGRLHPALQRQLIHRQLIALGVAPGFELVEQLRTQAERRVSGAEDVLLRRRIDGVVERAAAGQRDFQGAVLELDLTDRSRRAVFDGLEITWSLASVRVGASPPRFGAGFEYFDADKVGGGITLRHWRPGDRFQPIGLRSSVKLQDLFTNLRIPRADRRGLVLAATAGGEVFWVEGLRIGERFKLDKATRRRLIWRWRRGEGRVAEAGRAC